MWIHVGGQQGTRMNIKRCKGGLDREISILDQLQSLDN